eukprot:jgi/Chrzof1/9163/Cz03g38100.t1
MPDGKSTQTWAVAGQQSLNQFLQLSGAQSLEKDGARFVAARLLKDKETYRAIPAEREPLAKNIQIASSSKVFVYEVLSQNQLDRILSNVGALGLQEDGANTPTAPSTTHNGLPKVVALTTVDALQDNKKYWLIFLDYDGIENEVVDQLRKKCLEEHVDYLAMVPAVLATAAA